jgi:Holliday junction DNA helicase RuvA
MIAHLHGTLLSKRANRILVDISGVGYEVFIPVSSFYELGEIGSEVSLHTYTHVREDSLALYGFRCFRHRAEAGRDHPFRPGD